MKYVEKKLSSVIIDITALKNDCNIGKIDLQHLQQNCTVTQTCCVFS